MNADIVALLGEGFIETVIMVIGSGVLGSIIGIPLGVLLHVTDKGGLMPKLATNAIVGVIVNAVRSTPFIILLVAIYPLTRLIVGTTIGTTATLVPLVIGVAPFIARLVETSLREVDRGLIEAAQSMGATNMQIINKVLIPEAMPGIVAGVTIAIVTLVGYSAMAGLKTLKNGGISRHFLFYFSFVVSSIFFSPILMSLPAAISTNWDRRSSTSPTLAESEFTVSCALSSTADCNPLTAAIKEEWRDAL